MGRRGWGCPHTSPTATALDSLGAVGRQVEESDTVVLQNGPGAVDQAADVGGCVVQHDGAGPWAPARGWSCRGSDTTLGQLLQQRSLWIRMLRFTSDLADCA